MIDSVKISQPGDPLGGSAAKRDAKCFGEHNGQITISPLGGTPPYRYGLDDEDWNGSPIQIGLSAGTYVPKLIDRNGCTAELEPVVINQKDRVEVDLGPDFAIELGRDTQLLAAVFNASGAVEFAWTIRDSTWLSCMDCPDPFVEGLMYPHTFFVSVVDSAGCSAEDRITILVEKPRRIFVPTGFTPNDDGANDVLMVHGQASAKILDFKVYDRWGEMLFRATDFTVNDESAGWNGTFRDQPMDPGVYIWVLEAEYMDGSKELFKGNAMLIR